jgi:hypothetical protein
MRLIAAVPPPSRHCTAWYHFQLFLPRSFDELRMSLNKPSFGPNLFSRWIIASVTAVAVTWSSTAEAETWTSLRGTHSVQAELVGIWDGNVVLQLAGGRRVSVKLDNLRSESRIQAQKLARSLDENRRGRVEELQGNATAAAAPAPNPLPQPPAARAYTAPQKDASAGEFLNQLDAAISDGHIVAVFDALPPSYRNDVNEIVKLGATKISPSTWNSLVGTTHQLGDLIVTRQRWFLSSPRIHALPPDQLDIIEGRVLTFAGLLRDGLKPDAMQLETLQTTDFGQWLAERDQAIAPHLAQLFQYGDGGARQITVDSEKGGTASVTITGEGGSKKVTFTLVEGYWVPKTLADGWADSIDSLRKEIAETPNGTYLDSMGLLIAGIAPMIQPLAQATDAGRFHAAMESVLVPAETIVGGLAAMFGRNINLASRGGQGGFNGYDDEGMEDEMYDDMEMEEGMEDEEMEMDMEEEMEMEEE